MSKLFLKVKILREEGQFKAGQEVELVEDGIPFYAANGELGLATGLNDNNLYWFYNAKDQAPEFEVLVNNLDYEV